MAKKARKPRKIETIIMECHAEWCRHNKNRKCILLSEPAAIKNALIIPARRLHIEETIMAKKKTRQTKTLFRTCRNKKCSHHTGTTPPYCDLPEIALDEAGQCERIAEELPF